MPSLSNNASLPRLPTIEFPSYLEFLKLKSFPLKTFPPVNQPKKLTKDTLYIYGPGNEKFNDSFDVDCLQIQTYFKFCNIDVDICYSNEPAASPTNKLPYLATVVGKLFAGSQINDWIKDNVKQKQIIDKDISLGDHKDEAIAFISMIKSKLHSAWLFSIWLEPLNYNQNTVKVYYGHNPAPIDKIMGSQKKDEIVQSLLADRDILTREEIYSDAAIVLESLSNKLGDCDYFFGFEEPTWMDAVVFSYLHIILSHPQIKKSDIPKEEKNQATTLKKLVQKHDNLVQYAKQICRTYFE
ncbi:hypothetical protein BJ944DRAFT_161597 [Cunninghamella echinulata]|nr:hypothetical protein BJ944DRAFT_161597 [Cunninghamella echinulata]